MKFYIAFSIHGTNKFTVAEYTTRKRVCYGEYTSTFVQRCLGGDFKRIESRRKNHNEQTDGIKVSWTGLNAKGTGRPLRSASWVARRFKELEAQGWKIVQDKGCR